MKKKLKVGLYGNRGHQIQSKLYENKEAELVAVCDVSDSFFSEVKKHCKNVILYSSLEEMLEDTSLDLISLCSSKRSEQEMHAIMCLKAGKHVYAEKPAAFSEEGLERILTAARENGCEFHEMADSVFVEPYWSVRKLVKSGKIGEVIQVYVQKSYPLNIEKRPQDEDTDGGLVRQAGIHAVRFLEHITGLQVEDVQVRQTHLGNIDSTKGLYTASSWMMTLSNGGVASACVNYLNPKAFSRRGNESIRLFGTDGMVEITDGGQKTHLYTHNTDEGEIDIHNSDCVDYFKLLTEHLLYGNDMPFSQEEELHPLRVVIRAFNSAKTV